LIRFAFKERLSQEIRTGSHADPDRIANAKVGIFLASILAGVIGYLFLSRRSRYRTST
jgi:Na+/H+ antiporter NhaA